MFSFYFYLFLLSIEFSRRTSEKDSLLLVNGKMNRENDVELETKKVDVSKERDGFSHRFASSPSEKSREYQSTRLLLKYAVRKKNQLKQHHRRQNSQSKNSRIIEKRSLLKYNLITTQKYIELYLVNDLSIYEYYKRNITYIDQRSKKIAKMLNERFRQLQINIILVGIETWMAKDLIPITDNSKDTLLAFMRYREANINNRTKNDNAQLITKRYFDQGKKRSFLFCDFYYLSTQRLIGHKR